jgi:hypothetical protein
MTVGSPRADLALQETFQLTLTVSPGIKWSPFPGKQSFFAMSLILADSDSSGAVVGMILLLALYFLPTILGWKKRNAGAIAVLNFLLGWTVIGWIVALIWALTNDAPDPRVVVQSSLAPAAPMLCPKCGRYSQAGSAFCSQCGERWMPHQ